MKSSRFVILALIFSFIFSSCNLGAPAPQNGSEIATFAAQTVEAVLATATVTQILATPTFASGVAIDGTTAEPITCEQNNSIKTWQRDNISYDKTEAEKPLDSGQGFVMTWVIQNTGSCIWDDTYKLVFDSGERLTTQDSFPVMPNGFTVKSGELLTINITMTAPTKNGKFDSTFKMVDGQGNHVLFFGVITTVGVATTNPSLAAPGALSYAYDCSGGIMRVNLGWKDKADNETGFRIYRDGVQIAEISANSTSYEDIAPFIGTYQYTVSTYNAGGESPATIKVETPNC